MTLLDFTLLAISSLFVIVDPIAVVPAFLAMTPSDTPQERRRMARLASFVMAGVLLLFALLGKWIFRLFGITMPALEVAASIVLLLIALDMLRAQRSRVQETREETDAGAAKDDIAITPLNPAGMLDWPYVLSPQATTVPSLLSARLWSRPPATAATPLRFVGTLHWS